MMGILFILVAPLTAFVTWGSICLMWDGLKQHSWGQAVAYFWIATVFGAATVRACSPMAKVLVDL